MDFSWTPYFSGFGFFPLLCLLFMAIMIAGCIGLRFFSARGAHCCQRHDQTTRVTPDDATSRRTSS